MDVYISRPGGSREWLATLQVDAAGSIREVVGLPRSLQPGTYTLALYKAGTKLAEAQVSIVAATLSLDKGIAGPGDLVRIQARGLGSGYGFPYYVQVGGVVVATLYPDGQGTADALVTVPQLPSGSYKILLIYPGTPMDTANTAYHGPAVLVEARITVVNGIPTRTDLKDLEARINARLTSLENEVTLLNSSINSIQAGIEDMSSTLDSLKRDLDRAESNISSISNRLSKLESRLGKLEAELKQTSRLVGDLSARINSLMLSIESVKDTVNVLEDTVNRTGGKVSQLEQTVSNLEAEIAGLSMTLTATQKSVEQALSQLSDLSQELDQVKNSIVPELRDRITRLEASIDGLKERLQGEAQRINQLQEDLEDALSRIQSLETKSSTLGTRSTIATALGALGIILAVAAIFLSFKRGG